MAFHDLAKLSAIAAFGMVLQGASLTEVVLVSRTGFATLGKPVAEGVAIACMIASIWCARRSVTRSWHRFVAIPALLAIGYIVAWTILANVWFPGLQKDIDWRSLDYWISVGCVAGFLYVIYSSIAFVSAFISTRYQRPKLTLPQF